ncbi:hypothetical protein BGZ46_010340 [Entomortierella lignicola]|nr:hypothetical protein BGZ46_010340 [Entomortierella lignicola]
MQDHSADNYDSFLKMTDGLVRVIRNNKNLRCLQLKPIGRFPPRLLEALSQLDHLEFLSLNAWRDFQEYSLQLIMEACPGLSHLSLGENDFTRCTLETIHGNQTPKLSKPGLHRTDKSKARYKLERRLEFREQALDLQDEFFISLCRHIPRLQWIHAGMTGFSNGALDSIRVQCKDITSLNLDGTRGIQSKALDQLLRTCYSLRVMSARGVVLNARDMDRGSKWACRGLETLVLDIEIYAAITMPQSSGHNSRNQLSNQDSVKAVREYVYDQLGDLTRLQLLGIGGGHPVGGTEPGVDLTLESGLQKLDTLHCLEKLDIRRLARTQGENDLAWMVRQWPRFCSLEVSKGRTIKQTNDKTHKAIEWLSRTRPGMKISLI